LGYAGLGFAAFADLPFSLVADTLSLPITIPAYLKRSKNARHPYPEPTEDTSGQVTPDGPSGE
jgi:hypothetical protein